jgi:hypothetical protein
MAVEKRDNLNQRKSNQPCNQSPQDQTHVKAKVLSPWPTNLHFKNRHFQMCAISPSIPNLWATKNGWLTMKGSSIHCFFFKWMKNLSQVAKLEHPRSYSVAEKHHHRMLLNCRWVWFRSSRVVESNEPFGSPSPSTPTIILLGLHESCTWYLTLLVKALA